MKTLLAPPVDLLGPGPLAECELPPQVGGPALLGIARQIGVVQYDGATGRYDTGRMGESSPRGRQSRSDAPCYYVNSNYLYKTYRGAPG